MNIEFHYYITKILALEAGFEPDEAEIIAYSSQQVNDNNIAFKIMLDEDEEEIFETQISQIPDITNPKNELLRISLLYHYIPGDPMSYKAKRRDGKMHFLMPSAASNNSLLVTNEATKRDNMFLIGIASHAFSDTFSHQNFIGTYDHTNSMANSIDELVPKIGHEDVGIIPDIPNLIWDDTRMIDQLQEINNAERTIYAAQNLYKIFNLYTASENNWFDVKPKLEDIIGEGKRNPKMEYLEEEKKQRIEKYIEWLSEFDSDEIYDKDKWFKEAVDYDIKKIRKRKKPFSPVKEILYPIDEFEFEETNWFEFHQAIKQYERMTTKLLSPILEQINIPNW
ncbi:MAG: DUF6765 family protein [Candidatus Cloacimonadota bacterium]|nr:DUF6765 family protein [Candidatus Cloacimonadota bacterium]